MGTRIKVECMQCEWSCSVSTAFEDVAKYFIICGACQIKRKEDNGRKSSKL